MKLHIGVFAHNEESRIANIIRDLGRQSIFQLERVDVRVTILANGCHDETVKVASQAVSELPSLIKSNFRVADLEVEGKSRTWNHFVHTLSDETFEGLFFIDGDIRISNENNLELMFDALASKAERVIINSNPVKDISRATKKLTLTEKVILAGGGTADDLSSCICGQLYLARATAIKDLFMPVGLPVEDGFLRAMILTDILTKEEQLSRIYCDDSIWHTYESIRSVRKLISHQTRIVIGSAINSSIFQYLRLKADSYDDRASLLSQSARDESWLNNMLREILPRAPYGYIPFHFLFKRIIRMLSTRSWRPKSIANAVAGFSFDFTVYIIATVKMTTGKGAGYW